MKAARDFAIEAIDAGWDVLLQHGEDTGGSPFVSVEARRRADSRHLSLTWHTRQTGTYRLFSCMSNKRDVSLKVARAELGADS